MLPDFRWHKLTLRQTCRNTAIRLSIASVQLSERRKARPMH
jgi:hypothetical protein